MKRLLMIMLSAILVLSMLATLIACDSGKKSRDDDDDEEEEEGTGSTDSTGGSSAGNGDVSVEDYYDKMLELLDLSDGWIYAGMMESTATYMNLQTGETIIVRSETIEPLVPEEGEDIGEPDYEALEVDEMTEIVEHRFYKGYTEQVMGSDNVRMYLSMYAFAAVPDSDNAINVTMVVISERESERPITKLFEGILSY